MIFLLSRLLQFVVLALLLVAGCGPLPQDGEHPEGTVVLLHGLARTSNSMRVMEKALLADGYRTCNINYPSTYHSVAVLVREYVLPALRDCVRQGKAGPEAEDNILKDVRRAHFVTHSMGGVIMRGHLARHQVDGLGRLVLLAPPNKGSELVDTMKQIPGFDWLNGPAGAALSTDIDSIPNTISDADAEYGVIAGNLSLNPLYSSFIPGDDDGKVSVESTKFAAMADHITLYVSHTFSMNRAGVTEQVVAFLRTGRFTRTAD